MTKLKFLIPLAAIIGLASCAPTVESSNKKYNFKSNTYYIHVEGGSGVPVVEFEPKGSPGTLCIMNLSIEKAISCFKKDVGNE